MSGFDIGDAIGDCPHCQSQFSIIFRGGTDAVCKSCGLICEVSFEEEEEKREKRKAKPRKNAAAVAEQIQEASDSSLIGKLRLNRSKTIDLITGVENARMPGYILESTAWKWAHVLGRSGNPFRAGSRSHAIFNIIERGPATIHDIVKSITDSKDFVGCFTFLILIHDTLVQCIAAGLLIMDDESGMISVCKSKPKPRKVEKLS